VAKKGGERFDPVQFCLLFQQWPEEKRFPRMSSTLSLLLSLCLFPALQACPNSLRSKLISVLDLARILATISPSFGATCTPDALLTSCDWSLPFSSSKVKDTNTLLAFRTFANLFTTSAGRKNMTGMKVQEWLDALRRERNWEEVGGRKLPFVTIVLK